MGAAAGGRWGGTAPPGGDDRAGTVPPAPGGTCGGRGGGAGVRATRRRCVSVHVKLYMYGPRCGNGFKAPLVACTHP